MGRLPEQVASVKQFAAQNARAGKRYMWMWVKGPVAHVGDMLWLGYGGYACTADGGIKAAVGRA